MSRIVPVILAAGILVVGIGPLTASGTTKPKRKTIPAVQTVLGPKVTVPPSQPANPKFVKAFATCPKGYYASGGGVYSGAISEIAVVPMADGRTWLADGANIDTTPTHTGKPFTHRVAITCVRGRLTVKVVAAATNSDLRKLEQQFRAAHR